LPALRCEAERADPHPIYREFMQLKVSRAFSREDVRAAVIPAYMGLIKQIDDQLGVLFRFMQEQGLFENTLIVFTSDHGDYLGDHWLGEKDLFHEASVKVPFIIYDPAPEADARRGCNCDALVESIDLVPTFLDAMRADWRAQSHRLEGRSLLPWLRGDGPSRWRQFAVSEYNYAFLPVAERLGIAPAQATLFMIADRRWKLIHAPPLRPMLYDLQSDANEFCDRGADPAYAAERQRLADALAGWGLRSSQRSTRSDAEIVSSRGKSERRGVLIGVWDEAEVASDLWQKYLGGDS
jgi:arylsulfatase A-like enzyme